MEVKLTPWRVKPDSAHPWVIECEVNMPPGYPDTIYNTVGTVGYKPYAHLTAAAPDLMEALTAIVSHDAFDPQYLSTDLREKLEAGQAALAKATGLA